MVVLDWASKQAGDLAQVATIPPAAFVGTRENNIGFQPGDTITLRDLLYAALVQSDNIAAYTLADHVGTESANRSLGRKRAVPRGDPGRFLRPANERARPASWDGANTFP